MTKLARGPDHVPWSKDTRYSASDPEFELIRLAPRPTPTFVAPYSARRLRQSANEVFMDFAISFDPVEKYKLYNKELREQLDMTDYVLHVLLPEVFQGGAIPAHLARWVEKLSIKSLPESVREWSAPLPAEQWRAPSDGLIEASNATLEAYRKLQDSDAPTSFRNNRLQDLF